MHIEFLDISDKQCNLILLAYDKEELYLYIVVRFQVLNSINVLYCAKMLMAKWELSLASSNAKVAVI